MSFLEEFCDPFNNDPQYIWIKLEHCGRYLFAVDFLKDKNISTIADIASANGYGSAILADNFCRVIAIDRSELYLSSDYLTKKNISKLCMDVDNDDFFEALSQVDAVISFETIEHLRNPEAFLHKLSSVLHPSNWLILSFPNSSYEKLNDDGTNQDPYHLHILSKSQILDILEGNGFIIRSILGQSLCNQLCTLQNELIEKNTISIENVNSAFNYDRQSVITLSKLLA